MHTFTHFAENLVCNESRSHQRHTSRRNSWILHAFLGIRLRATAKADTHKHGIADAGLHWSIAQVYETNVWYWHKKAISTITDVVLIMTLTSRGEIVSKLVLIMPLLQSSQLKGRNHASVNWLDSVLIHIAGTMLFMMRPWVLASVSNQDNVSIQTSCVCQQIQVRRVSDCKTSRVTGYSDNSIPRW